MERTQCPHCKKVVTFKRSDELPHFPFCSERCKMADLGMWFRGEHRIPDVKADSAKETTKPKAPNATTKRTTR